MDKLIYVAMSGARQIEMATIVNNHNLANINTPGFRGDLTSMVARQSEGPGFQTRVYAGNTSTLIDFSPGTIITTGRELDVAINGDGLLAVMAEDGSEAYTRRGDFRIDAGGILITGDGNPVMGNGGPIAIPPAEKIEIAADGTVSIRPIGQDANALAIIDRIRLVNPEPASLVKGKEGLLRRSDGEPSPADASIRLATGSLEKSNVNVIQTVVNMIALSRSYEMQMNLITKATEMDTSTAELVRLS
jgi:flagellar basal-body rod protein FlgF